MKITLEWLKEKNACSDAVDAWEIKGEECDPVTVVELAMEMDRFDWANWLIVRCMTKKQYVSYAVFAAEQVVDIFEKEYPGDDRVRKSIEAAKAYMAASSKKNKAVTYALVAVYNFAPVVSAAHAAVKTTAARKELEHRIITYGIALLKQK